ncbi:AGAP007195-PA [Anopheles gambiae str. PEST]|uniref:AGAP007195-PA n=1 Tax=Anopheles gambiae TaxID=7165 RepID=Q52P94_ANOGA|nr:hyp6.3 precursor [Anopheles gambiae]EAU77654.1 AGAP007195-PA [Anopheles gambiae str. PEST]
MKFAFAFVLIALFAVFAVSQALPQPEQAAASSNDGASAITKIVLELTPEQAAAVQKMGGRGFWPIMMKSVKKIMAIGCDLIDC